MKQYLVSQHMQAGHLMNPNYNSHHRNTLGIDKAAFYKSSGTGAVYLDSQKTAVTRTANQFQIQQRVGGSVMPAGLSQASMNIKTIKSSSGQQGPTISSGKTNIIY